MHTYIHTIGGREDIKIRKRNLEIYLYSISNSNSSKCSNLITTPKILPTYMYVQYMHTHERELNHVGFDSSSNSDVPNGAAFTSRIRICLIQLLPTYDLSWI